MCLFCECFDIQSRKTIPGDQLPVASTEELCPGWNKQELVGSMCTRTLKCYFTFVFHKSSAMIQVHCVILLLVSTLTENKINHIFLWIFKYKYCAYVLYFVGAVDSLKAAVEFNEFKLYWQTSAVNTLCG